jgi:hypothetical protein
MASDAPREPALLDAKGASAHTCGSDATSVSSLRRCAIGAGSANADRGEVAAQRRKIDAPGRRSTGTAQPMIVATASRRRS